VDSHYNKAAEASIAFDDPQLAIDWRIPAERQILSSKDQEHLPFEAAPLFDYQYTAL
jgi:dTDP-4-dehydrorhamnose 3,5-epimerase